MSFEKNLSVKNLKRKPGRSAALILLAAFLSLSIFAGSVVVTSLRNGLDSYEARLGADIVAVPYEATTKKELEAILLQGIPGYFYMDGQYLDKIRATEGVAAASPQFYLATASAGCCSVAVQIIGFDPLTDFSIQPWIAKSYSGTLGDGDVIVGSDITLNKNMTLKFYNTPVTIVAQLEKTGTGLDSAIYANMNTIQQMMKNAQELGFKNFDGVNADRVISSVMIKVADGYSIEDVTGDLNIHSRRQFVATQSKSMISSIASGLGGVSRMIGILTIMIWLLALVILVIAFAMIANERKKEFAVLRVMGASRKSLSRLMLTESAMVSAVGAVIGIVIAALLVFAFSGVISEKLQLPYLLPGAGKIALLAIGSLLLAILAGSLTSAIAVRRIAKSDTGLILREGA